jgi:hypothetical protein
MQILPYSRDDLGYGDCTALEPVLEEVSRLLVAYAKAVARKQFQNHTNGFRLKISCNSLIPPP